MGTINVPIAAATSFPVVTGPVRMNTWMIRYKISICLIQKRLKSVKRRNLWSPVNTRYLI